MVTSGVIKTSLATGFSIKTYGISNEGNVIVGVVVEVVEGVV